MRKPTLFKNVILPWLLISFSMPAIVLFVLEIIFNGLPDMVLVQEIFFYLGLVFVCLFMLGAYYFSIEYDYYKHKLHDWKYHQITWDEYLKERGKLEGG